MPRIDYHLHTALCHHAHGTPDQFAAAARVAGLDEIGFADHNPLPAALDDGNRMAEAQLPHYWDMIGQTRERFPDLHIKCGLEVDYLPGGETYLAQQIARFPFDYITGSVHYLGDWNFDNPIFLHRWDAEDVDGVYRAYFESLNQLIETGMFDILAHPDLVKKFGHRPRELDLEPLYWHTCQLLQRHDVCLEINTAGLRKQVAEIYPHQRFIEIAAQTGVTIVIGSDAHTPEEVGCDYDRAIASAQAAGFSHIQQFTRRQRTSVAL